MCLTACLPGNEVEDIADKEADVRGSLSTVRALGSCCFLRAVLFTSQEEWTFMQDNNLRDVKPTQLVCAIFLQFVRRDAIAN